MTPGFALGIANLFLALVAGLVSIGIFQKVSGRLATSWRYMLAAFLVLAMTEVVGSLGNAVKGVFIQQMLAFFFQVGHLAFILLAFVGLLHQFRVIKKLTGDEEGQG